MKTKLERTLLPIGFLILAGVIIFLWVKLEGIGQKPTPYGAVPDQYTAEPAGAEMATEAAMPVTYVSWQLTRGSGAIVEVGAMRVASNAWRHTPRGEERDPAEFIKDVIKALSDNGTLGDTDLGKTNSNWLTILWPGGTPRPYWILDSRDIPQSPKEG